MFSVFLYLFFRRNARFVPDRAIPHHILWSEKMAKYARKMTSKEAKALISDVIMGKNMGIINDVKENLIELSIMTEPASIEAEAKKQLTPDQRDVKRAEIIRSRL